VFDASQDLLSTIVSEAKISLPGVTLSIDEVIEDYLLSISHVQPIYI